MNPRNTEFRTRVWNYGSFRVPTRALIFFVCVWFVFVFSGLYDERFTRSEEYCRVFLCLSVCNLGTSINNNNSFSLAATPQKETNTCYTHIDSKPSRRLLPAPRKCRCLSCVDPFIRHIFNKLYLSKMMKSSEKCMTCVIMFLFYRNLRELLRNIREGLLCVLCSTRLKEVSEIN
jgi:hypothetical protein